MDYRVGLLRSAATIGTNISDDRTSPFGAKLWNCEVSHEGVWCTSDNVQPEIHWTQPPTGGFAGKNDVENCITIVGVLAMSTIILIAQHRRSRDSSDCVFSTVYSSQLSMI